MFLSVNTFRPELFVLVSPGLMSLVISFTEPLAIQLIERINDRLIDLQNNC